MPWHLGSFGRPQHTRDRLVFQADSVQGLWGRVLREDNEAPTEASPPFPLSLLGMGFQMEDAGRILLWPP